MFSQLQRRTIQELRAGVRKRPLRSRPIAAFRLRQNTDVQVAKVMVAHIAIGKKGRPMLIKGGLTHIMQIIGVLIYRS